MSVIPSDATSIRVTQATTTTPGGEVQDAMGTFVVIIQTKSGKEEQIVATGMDMILLLGAYITQRIDQDVFAPLIQEIQDRNTIIDAVNNLMPIAVDAMNADGNNWLSGSALSTWNSNIGKIPKEMFNGYNYGWLTDSNVTANDATQLLEIFQNTLTKQTQANEQTMLTLNTQSNLRTTFFGLMQSNMSAFKQSLENSARS